MTISSICSFRWAVVASRIWFAKSTAAWTPKLFPVPP